MSELSSVSGFYNNAPTRSVESQRAGASNDWGYALKLRTSVHRYDAKIVESLLVAQKRHIFKDLKSRLMSETWWVSSDRDLRSNENYQRIISLGGNAVTFLLECMRSGEVDQHCFPLLYDLTGERPVPPHSRGNLDEMAQAWLQWGYANAKL